MRTSSCFARGSYLNRGFDLAIKPTPDLNDCQSGALTPRAMTGTGTLDESELNELAAKVRVSDLSVEEHRLAFAAPAGLVGSGQRLEIGGRRRWIARDWG